MAVVKNLLNGGTAEVSDGVANRLLATGQWSVVDPPVPAPPVRKPRTRKPAASAEV